MSAISRFVYKIKVKGQNNPGLGFNDDLEHKLAVFVDRLSSGLESFFRCGETLEAMGDHVVETGYCARGQNLDSDRVCICIAEDTDDVNFFQVRC